MGITRTATCECGSLKLHCDGDPAGVSICHCHACKRRTGSVFSWNARWAKDATKPDGEASTYTRVGDDGGAVTYHFCPSCGVSVFYEHSELPDWTLVVVGAFADEAFPAPTATVYDLRRPDWLVLNADPMTCID